ncbi:MAG: ABC transporter ATP-binding protein [Clostridia bacterium]|nr:ABC transporter ATP-binding protein [Clostridia bacterium]
MAIEIKNVSKHFKGTCALNNVSFVLKENRIYGLLGNNGAGKTTLFNIMTNRLYPDSGEVLVNGGSVVENDHVLGSIFMMGEENYYPEDMKVKKAFETTKIFYPDFDQEYACSLANQFGLDTKKKISKLSTGYVTIFKLILALSVNTPYVLFDEPVLGLDAQHRDMFYKLLIEKYSQKPFTAVISTHIIQEVAEIIEYTIIIKDGAIIKNALSEELLSSCRAICGPADRVDAFVWEMRVINETKVGKFKTACVENMPEGLAIPDGLEVGKVNMQDYFISLMNEEDKKQ